VPAPADGPAYNGLFDLRGKVALVTGGNSGLGFGFATGIAKCGGDVVIWSRRQDRNEVAAERLRAFGVRVHHQAVDVTDEAQVVEGMKAAVEGMGRLDCVISNAGISSRPDSFVNMTTAMYLEMVSVAQHGGFYTLREGIRHMMDRHAAGDPGGSVIGCGSLSAVRGIPTMEHYAAAKGALVAMIKSIAVEFGPYGIRANAVLPGQVKTNLGGRESWPEERERERAARDQLVAERTPLRRLGTVADVEGIAAYLMSDAASWHTGDVITLDGGITVTH
jgi:NAD(P)-dependent dehydrogenase (short-subunit alcohol dehydrogenase family)